MNENNSSTLLHLKSPWNDLDGSIWVFSSLSLVRNLERSLFPSKLPLEKQKQLLSLFSEKLLGAIKNEKIVLIQANSCSPLEKGYLTEQFFLPVDLQKAHSGEALVVDPETGHMIFINMGDHFHFFAVDPSDHLEALWKSLIEMEQEVSQALPFAFSARFGFLTADAKICGTGLKVRVFLQLPALIHTIKLSSLLKHLEDEAIEVKGIWGQSSDWIGDIVVIENRYTVGITEENILSWVKIFAHKLVSEEKKERVILKQSESVELKDKVSRAFAILLHSYKIESTEAMNALGLVKLGVELQWVGEITTHAMNELMVGVRRDHLVAFFGEEISHDALPHRRAEFLHQALKEAKLHI